MKFAEASPISWGKYTTHILAKVKMTIYTKSWIKIDCTPGFSSKDFASYVCHHGGFNETDIENEMRNDITVVLAVLRLSRRATGFLSMKGGWYQSVLIECKDRSTKAQQYCRLAWNWCHMTGLWQLHGLTNRKSIWGVLVLEAFIATGIKETWNQFRIASALTDPGLTVILEWTDGDQGMSKKQLLCSGQRIVHFSLSTAVELQC